MRILFQIKCLMLLFVSQMLLSQEDHVLTKFRVASLISQPEIVPCELSNNSESLCVAIRVKGTPFKDGPYCPRAIGETGGIYPYDGQTNPGLRVLNDAFFQDMESDGYDILEEQGKVRVLELDFGSGEPPPIPTDVSVCIEVKKIEGIELKYLMPFFPQFDLKPNPMDDALDIVGLAFSGVPINGQPPSIADGVHGDGVGAGNLPALDPCGGHQNEGFYHSHLFAESINQQLLSLGIDEVACSSLQQYPKDALFALAMDGFPIYGAFESGGYIPKRLDECNGHYGPTHDFPMGIYHYHVRSDTIVNIPACLKGVVAKTPLIVKTNTSEGESLK